MTLKNLLIEIHSEVCGKTLHVDFHECIFVFYCQNVQKIQTGEVGVHQPWIRLSLYKIFFFIIELT